MKKNESSSNSIAVDFMPTEYHKGINTIYFNYENTNINKNIDIKDTVTINFIDPGTGGSGVATIVDSNTNRVDNSNIGRRVILTYQYKRNYSFDILIKKDVDNYRLPLDINGMVIGFKKIDGMIQLPLNNIINPDKIERFELDFSQLTSTEVDIECEMLRFDYYFESTYRISGKIDALLAENNNNLINKIIGFRDNLSPNNIFLDKGIISTPKMMVIRCTKTLTNYFKNCKSLNLISPELFSLCTDVTMFDQPFYSCTSLENIPEELFSKNKKVSHFNGLFYRTNIKHIPSNLFRENLRVEEFGTCFAECDSLLSIPNELFYGLERVNRFYMTFRNCGSLISIPDNLFNSCVNITSLEYVFQDCTSLTTVPFNLFDNCANLRSVYACFWDSSSITSSLPDVWNKEKFPNIYKSEKYARACTKVANYADIPNDFK